MHTRFAATLWHCVMRNGCRKQACYHLFRRQVNIKLMMNELLLHFRFQGHLICFSILTIVSHPSAGTADAGHASRFCRQHAESVGYGRSSICQPLPTHHDAVILHQSCNVVISAVATSTRKSGHTYGTHRLVFVSFCSAKIYFFLPL